MMKIAKLYNNMVDTLFSVSAVCVFFCPFLAWAAFEWFFPLHWGWAVAMIGIQIYWSLVILDKALC